MNAAVETPNASTETLTKTESALSAYVKSLDPKFKPNASDKKATAAKLKEFLAKRAAALEALKNIEKEETEVSKECIKVFGKQKLIVGGVEYVPTSRDERIYYKQMGEKGIEI